MSPIKRALLGTAAVIGFTVAGTAAASACTVGVSWSNFQEERWKTDEAAIVEALDAAGCEYISADAQSSPAKQLADVETLIARGSDALIVLAQDNEAIIPAVEAAVAEGIPVVAYDRLIEHQDAFYITFDNIEVGRMQARAVFAAQPTGNYVFIKGSSADPNADFLHSGQLEVLVASNDGTAGGVVAALTAQGMEGAIPVSGQDGDHAALNRVALGTQTVSVWKDARDLGRAAAEIAAELVAGTAMSDIDGAIVWDGGSKGIAMSAIFLAPQPVTQENLSLVIDAGWVSQEVVCQGVASGSIAACP